MKGPKHQAEATDTASRCLSCSRYSQPTRQLTKLVADHADPGTEMFTDKVRGYLPLSKMGYGPSAVKHSMGEYVDGMAHTNVMESFWSLLKRGYHGTYHQMSHELLHRNVAEFRHRQNEKPEDTIDQMAWMVRGLDGWRFTYEQLI